MKFLFALFLIAVAVIVIRKVVQRSRQAALQRQYQEQCDIEEREWLSAVNEAESYLDNIPIRKDESSFTEKWNAINSSYVYKKSTYHDYILGTRSEISDKLKEEMQACWHMHKKRDPQVKGWSSILKMFEKRQESCTYRWGENRDGVIIMRFGDDKYAFVKTHQDEVFQ